MRLFRALVIVCAAAAPCACSKISSSNVGTPSSVIRFDFQKGLDLVRAGMPADSLELLFRDVESAGQAGILSRARVRTAETERIRYRLGWRSDPKHQLGVKASDELDVALATVLVIDKAVVSVERYPLP